MDVFISGQVQPHIQPANETYYNTVPEYKQNTGTSHNAGSDID
jgi:hypothetical protein